MPFRVTLRHRKRSGVSIIHCQSNHVTLREERRILFQRGDFKKLTEHLMTYKIGAKVSVCTTDASWDISATIVGST